jgi:hypothetical protein
VTSGSYTFCGNGLNSTQSGNSTFYSDGTIRLKSGKL